jgi:hypothetical protein
MNHPRRDFLKQLAILAPALIVGCDRGEERLTSPAPTAPVSGNSGANAMPSSGVGAGSQADLPPENRPFQVGTKSFGVGEFQRALNEVPDGGTLAIRTGFYHVTGVLRHDNVTIKAVGGKAILDGLNNPSFPAQGKGLIVQQSRAATYEDIIFGNVRVRDGNGVGVRIEGVGTTTFRRCEFRDSQQAIFTQNLADCHVALEHCVGENLGAEDGKAHGIYCGAIGSLTVIGGTWRNVQQGHLVKSRAARTRIENVRLEEGRASLAIDVPNGGVVEVLGCTFIQSQATGNSEIIGYGREVKGPHWPENSFTFRANNTVTDTRVPRGRVIGYAEWFSNGTKIIERYTYNGSNANPPGATV